MLWFGQRERLESLRLLVCAVNHDVVSLDDRLTERVAKLERAAAESEKRLADAKSALAEAAKIMRETSERVARTVAGPPDAEIASWPRDLIAQIDWERWGRKPPSGGDT